MYAFENGSNILSVNVYYHDIPNFWANSADPDQTAPDQGLHFLIFYLLLFYAFCYGKTTLFKFKDGYSNFLGVQVLGLLRYTTGNKLGAALGEVVSLQK